MGIARSVLNGVKDKFLKKYGDKIVRSMADTSSDAPNKYAAPKRDLYDKLKEEGALANDGKKDR